MRFTATILQAGKTATGIPVPAEVIDQLGGGRKPAVSVTLNGFTYRTTVGSMGGQYLIPVSAERRSLAKVSGGDTVDVELELDDKPREIDVPADVASALDSNPAALAAFEALSYSNKSRHVLSVTGAKTDETRQRRIAKMLADLAG